MEIMSIHVYIFPFYDYYDYVCDTIKGIYTEKIVKVRMVLDIRLYIITFRDIHMCKMKSLSAVYFVYYYQNYPLPSPLVLFIDTRQVGRLG